MIGGFRVNEASSRAIELSDYLKLKPDIIGNH